MERLLLFLPATLFFCLIGLLYYHFHRDEKIWDIPFRDDKERTPGESVRVKLDELWDDMVIHLLLLMFAALLPLVFLPFTISENVRFIIIGISILGIIICFLGVWRLLPRIRNHKIGFQGERLTAQYLQPLFCRGYFVFHDIPMKDYNVDHVVVGPNGVFAVETKTRRKKRSAGTDRAKVIYDGKSLQYPECQPETFGLEAAVSRAKGFQDWLSSAIGEPVTVMPILSLPGWYVKRKGLGGLVVKNPKTIPDYISKTVVQTLSDIQIKRIRHQVFHKSKSD